MLKVRFLFALLICILSLSIAGVHAWAMTAQAWATAVSQTSTSNSLWGMVTDSSGNPLAGIAPTVTGATAVITPSNSAGFYALTVPTNTLTYTVHWDVPGYGSLPATWVDGRFTDTPPPTDIALPPIDNLIQNAHFEEGLSHWTSPNSAQASAHHTGQQGALLGAKDVLDVPLFTVYPVYYNEPTATEVLEGQDGTLHILFVQRSLVANSNHYYLTYIQRQANGVWQEPVIVAQRGENDWGTFTTYQADLDANGVLHVVWFSIPELYYRQRQPDGTWSTPEVYFSGHQSGWSGVMLAVSPQGEVHLLWSLFSLARKSLVYRHRSLDGIWTTTFSFPSPDNGATLDNHQMLMDDTGLIHLITRYTISTGVQTTNFYHQIRALDGTWSDLGLLATDLDPHAAKFRAVMGLDNTLHVVWENVERDLMYRQWAEGTWTVPETAVDNDPNIYPGFWYLSALEGDGRVYIAFTQGENEKTLSLVERDLVGGWHFTNVHSVDGQDIFPSKIVQTSDQTLYLSWRQKDLTTGAYYFFWKARDQNGVWQPIWQFPEEATYFQVWSIDNEIFFATTEKYIPHPENPSLDNQYHLSLFAGQLATTTNTESIAQSLTIPMTMTSPVLSWMSRLDGELSGDETAVSLKLTSGGQETTLWQTTAVAPDWDYHSADLSPWVGQTVTLTYYLSDTAGQLRPRFSLDEVTLGSVLPDVAVNMGETNAWPGETAVYALEFGNHGGAPAPTSTLTFTLPSEITFASASITPTTVISDHVLVWELGTLPGKYWQSLTVSGTITVTAVFGDSYSHTLSISTTALEAQTGNNTLTRQTVIGYRQYLPIIRQANP